MWWRILAGSVRNRKLRLALAILSVVLGAGLVAALTNLSLDIPQKAGSQLRAYGANILVLPRTSPAAGENYIGGRDLSFLDQLQASGAIAGYSPYLYGVVEIAGQRAVLAGTWLDSMSKTAPWWQVTGRWPDGRDDVRSALVGVQAAGKLGLTVDQEIEVKYGGNARNYRVVGTVSTGAAEDSQVIVSLKAAQELMGLDGKIGLVQVSALARERPLSVISRSIEQGIPGAEARVVGQIARAEGQVLGKVQFLMALVAALISIASGLVILSTMTTTLMERTPEISLMKALGAGDRRLLGLLGTEVGLIAISGGVAGYLLGFLLAQFVGQRVFASPVNIRLLAFLASLGVAIVVTALSSAVPLRRAMKIDPAVILKGE